MSRVPFTMKQRFEVFSRDNFTCQYCGARAPNVQLVVDHIVPVARGGTNDELNLVSACFSCNAGKSASLPELCTPKTFLLRRLVDRLRLQNEASAMKRAIATDRIMGLVTVFDAQEFMIKWIEERPGYVWEAWRYDALKIIQNRVARASSIAWRGCRWDIDPEYNENSNVLMMFPGCLDLGRPS